MVMYDDISSMRISDCGTCKGATMKPRKIKNKIKDSTGYIAGIFILIAMGLGETPM